MTPTKNLLAIASVTDQRQGEWWHSSNFASWVPLTAETPE